MKNILLSLLTCGIFAAGTMAQQPENAGFEAWENAGTVKDEPVDWSSIKTSDAGSIINNTAPVVWDQSTDAHTGNYSLELFNVLTIGSIVATGTITNGRIHADFNPANGYSYTDPTDAKWHTPLTARPDSVAVWAKYFPQGSDTAQIKVVLHTGEGTLPPTPENQGNWIAYAQINIAGSHEDWTYFKVPFTYFSQSNPEYVLMILTAGAGLAPTEGSVVRYDDLEFIYNPSGINDHSINNSLVYAYGNSVYLNKLPADFHRDSRMDFFRLDGSNAGYVEISSPVVNLNHSSIKPGLYVIRVQSREGIYSQKIQIW